MTNPDPIPSAHEDVISLLDRFETRKNVRVLLAVESGSRAWGFDSIDGSGCTHCGIFFARLGLLRATTRRIIA